MGRRHSCGHHCAARTAAVEPDRHLPVLIDCDHDEACSDAFVGPALMTGAHVHFVRSARTRRDIGDTARRLGVRVIDLPMEHDALASLMEDLPISSP